MSDFAVFQHYRAPFMLESDPCDLQRQIMLDHRERRKRLGSFQLAPKVTKKEINALVSSEPEVDYVRAIAVALSLLERDKAEGEITIRRIQDAICRAVPMYRNEMLSPRRDPNITVPRQMAVALCKELTKESLLEIGRQFGRNHSTIIHCCRKMHIVLMQMTTLDSGDMDKIAKEGVAKASLYLRRKAYASRAK